MAFVSTDEIRTPALVVRSQSSIDGATPQLAMGSFTERRNGEKMRERNLIVLLGNKRSIKKWRGRSSPDLKPFLFLSSSRVIENAPPPPLQDIKKGGLDFSRGSFFYQVSTMCVYIDESPILFLKNRSLVNTTAAHIIIFRPSFKLQSHPHT